MDIFSKKTLLSAINGGSVALGAPSEAATVKFQYATSIATAAASQTAGALTFAADSNGNAAIYAQGTLVSSKIQNVVAAAATGAKHGGKTITVTYIGDAGSIQTDTFNVIDEAGLEAYFANSKTIALDSNNIFEVKTDSTTILVDENNGLKSGLKLVYVPASAASGDDPAVDAHIALSNNANTELYTIPVANIVGNGILDHSSYDKQKNELHLFFKTAQAGVFNEVIIPVGEILDINDIFINNDSSIYLTATADTSVMNLGVLTVDPSLAAADNTGLADALKVKQYVDSKTTDLAVTGAGDNTYINLAQDANDNKKLNASAFVNDLVYAAGTDDSDPATLTGSAGLVDGAQAGTAISNFVNQRLTQKVATLDASIDSTGTTFVEVGVAEVDGKITNVKVTEHIGSLSGTASAISGTAGLIDGAAAATAISTYVEGRLDASIQALDASITADTTSHDISIYLEEVDGKVTTVGVEHTAATVTYTPAASGQPANLEGSGSFVMAGDINAIKNYVDAVAGALDSSVEDTDNGKGYVYVKTVQENGGLSEQIVNVTYGEITAAPGAITIDNNGIIDSSVLKEAVEGALTWTILS